MPIASREKWKYLKKNSFKTIRQDGSYIKYKIKKRNKLVNK